MFEEPNCSISIAALSPVWSIKISLSAKRPPDNKNKANEIINDILRYAYSSTNDSSKFIKISE